MPNLEGSLRGSVEARRRPVFASNTRRGATRGYGSSDRRGRSETAASQSGRGPRRCYLLLETTFADLIVTGSTGTYLCGPLAAVFTCSIFLTTSIPATTLPNTASPTLSADVAL